MGALISGTAAYVIYRREQLVLAEERFDPTKRKPRLVILGTGWGAATMVKDLNLENYEVAIVSPRNYFLFTPLLPSTTVGTIDFRSIVENIRSYLRRHRSNAAMYYEASCTDIDHVNKKVHCKDESDVRSAVSTFELEYDYLVIAVGAFNNTFGTPGVRENTFFLKDINDSICIRRKIMDCFETANLPHVSPEEKQKLLHFVIVGGGPTGVEFAGELQDFIKEDLVRHFPNLCRYANVTLIQSADHILNTYAAAISAYAEKNFQKEEIELITNARVTDVRAGEMTVTLKKTKEEKVIPFGCCIWSTGIAPNTVVKRFCESMPNIQKNRKGVTTDHFMRVLGAEGVYAIGDCATVEQRALKNKFVDLFAQADADGDGSLTQAEFAELIRVVTPEYPQLKEYAYKVGKLFAEADINKDGELSIKEFEQLLEYADKKMTDLPATAQVASQQGKYLAKSFNDMVTGQPIYPFDYKHKGSLAYVGGNTAVAEIGNQVLGGLATWYLWRSVYLSQQHSLRCKLSIAWDWTKTIIFGRDTSRF